MKFTNRLVETLLGGGTAKTLSKDSGAKKSRVE